ncbi:MAG: cytochrome c [Acidobacteria bacterium]|nr:cytochrome c [Acidobacteriota bacterium]
MDLLRGGTPDVDPRGNLTFFPRSMHLEKNVDNPGRKTWLVPILALGFMALFAWAGHWIVQRRESRPSMDMLTKSADPATRAVTRGKWLFWTRGRCHTCHRIDGRGYSARGPGLDGGRLGAAIGFRAGSRAREREQQLGTPVSATDYLVESLISPGVYLVEGYRNEMPPAHLPPQSLETDDVRDLVAYLQSVGGEVDISSIRIPEETR